MNERPLSLLADAERRDRLRLIRSENVGPIAFRRLLDRIGTAAAALGALLELARRGGRRKAVRVCSAAEAEAEIAALATHGARLIVFGDLDYPPQLAAIEDAPAIFAVVGDAALASRPCIAVVGSRNASLNGRGLARDLACALGAAGFVVVSGLARGIDAEAHRGALATGTVAVLASGVDVCYPQENAELYSRIAEQGALVSEARPGMAPQARHFPRRNRVISGLCRGVLVVEANLRSGSLITARMAAEQGREVFAVSGSPLDPRARGCNDLIRQGATLTESVADVLAALGSSFTPPPAWSQSSRRRPPTTARERTKPAAPWRKCCRRRRSRLTKSSAPANCRPPWYRPFCWSGSWRAAWNVIPATGFLRSLKWRRRTDGRGDRRVAG